MPLNKKKMFSKFTNILQQAVDAIAPNLTLQEEFVHHWKSITNYFIENKDEKLPADQTNLPAHLEQMLAILQQEEISCESGSTGPCMEYMMHHKLLETLYTLGKNDSPPGMKQVVLCFFTRLLTRIKQPLLPHINVHRAVQRLVRICGEVKSGPCENEEIQFLCTLCAKIKSDPYLVNFFLEVPKSVESPKYPQLSPLSQMSPKSPKRSLEFSIVNSLLAMCSSEDGRVAVKACEGLMLCASLPEKSAATCLIENTRFCSDMTNRLIKLYQRLPTTIDPDELDAVYAKWGLDVISEPDDKQTFAGKRNVVCFLSWLDYCDQLITIANPMVGRALAKHISTNFLRAIIEPGIMQTSEAGVVTCTAYLRRCLKTVSSILLSEFAHFMLGEEKQYEKNAESSCKIRNRLIQHCNHLSEEVSLISLKLFDTLIQKNDSFIVYNLVLRNLEHGKHIRPGVTCHMSPLAKCPSLLTTNTFAPPGSVDTETESLSESSDSKPKELMVPPENISIEGQPKDANGSIPQKDDPAISPPQPALTTDSSSSSSSSGPALSASAVPPTQSTKEVPSNFDSDTDAKVVGTVKEEKEGENAEEDKKGFGSETSSSIAEDGDVDVKRTPKSTEQDESGEPVPDSTHSESSSSPSNTEYYRSEVSTIFNSYLCLLPEDIKSAAPTSNSGYNMYLHDAHEQFNAIEEMCQNWEWPSQMSLSSESEHDFYEGSFLQMLFAKLSRMLDQSYAMNLQITSVISHLALFPHPILNDYLLDPALPVTDNVKLLYNILQKVVSDIKARKRLEPQFAHKLQMTRTLLMDEERNLKSMDNENFNQMSAVIVLEEFCKELSAIAFVKQYAAITRQTPSLA